MGADERVTLRGEGLIALSRPGAAAGGPPAGVATLPGPCLIAALRSGDDGGAGLFLLRPVHVGMRPALCVTAAVVPDHSTRARLQQWAGIPAEIGHLDWIVDGRYREVTWSERGWVLAGSVGKMGWPLAFAFSLAQLRADEPTLLPVRTAGMLRRAAVRLEIPDDDPMKGLGGLHLGWLFGSVHPAGVLSRLAPSTMTAEPASRGWRRARSRAGAGGVA
jgi:hypothetical protein